jgi:NitT/TauT family transport system substrate-binding protein
VIDARGWSFALALAAGALLSPFTAVAQETIKLGLLPFSESLAAVIADKQGYFKDAGIAVEIAKFDSGAIAVPVLQSGRMDIVLSNTVATFQAIEHLTPWCWRPERSCAHGDSDTTAAVMARKGASCPRISKASGSGWRFINSTAWLHAVAWLEKHGRLFGGALLRVPFPDERPLLNGRLMRSSGSSRSARR